MSPYVLTVTLNPALDKTLIVQKLEAGGLNRVVETRTDAGGKGINAARVLKRFGVDVIATGFIAGENGEKILKLLEDEKITSSFFNVTGETRTNLKIFEKSSNKTTEVNEAGFSLGRNELNSFGELLGTLLENASFLILSGSLPVGVDPNIYADFIKLAKSKGVRTILDADGEAFMRGIIAGPFAVKPNIYELEKLAGSKISNERQAIQAAKSIQRQGVEMVVVSMGAEGALLIENKEIIRAKSFPITPLGTVGAGDSMVAALVYSFLNSYSLRDTAQFITAAGTITASKPGARTSTLEEAILSMKAIKVHEL